MAHAIALVEFVEAKTESKAKEINDANLKVLATGEDIAKDIASVRVEMHSIKAELIKWMFIFWVGQIGALVAILMLFFKK